MICNFNKEGNDRTKVYDLAKNSRTTIFDFNYPLSSAVNKEEFECMILNKFMMRRINFETFTLFKIQLNVKLNEIMPNYNKLFDSLENWNLFNDGETTKRNVTDDRNITTDRKSTIENNVTNILDNKSTTSTNEISDRRFSDTPQNQLQNVKDGKYVTNYNYDENTNTGTDSVQSTGTSNSNNVSDENLNTQDKNNTIEEIVRTPSDKISIYKEFIDSKQNIYSMIFKDLDILFYQII